MIIDAVVALANLEIVAQKKWRNRLGQSGFRSSASYFVDKQCFKPGQKRPERI